MKATYTDQEKQNRFIDTDIKSFEPETKIGLLSTINADGLPHLTLITTIQANTPTQLIWGQFTKGMSKQHVLKNPNTGFLIMTMNRSLWRGKARYLYSKKEGHDYEMFNSKPMFRYNAYFGIHTVHYMELIETYGREQLPLTRIITASVMSKIATWYMNIMNAKKIDDVMNRWTYTFFSRLDVLKFMTYIDQDGFPKIIPIIQCQALNSHRLIFSSMAYSTELYAIQKHTQVAIYGLSMNMESVLVRGAFSGFDSVWGCELGAVDVNWVYNSMPPKPGQIFPKIELTPVVDF
ncbi:MAG: hypothetical protein HQK77_02310 [Desulfobacterales bacterium]|nr:hypothetical protein [Desulfobacterales bacterium]